MPLELSVLDQSPIREGGTAAQAVSETLTLATIAERLGYSRYWLAEHHNTPGLACASPEVLIPQVAARTSAIRVGSGGVLLSHYSPLKVAETFRMLETLFPGRIDLGIGRAPGSDPKTAVLLANGQPVGVEAFPQQVYDLVGFLRNEFDAQHEYARIRAMPDGPGIPEIWLLGSATESARLAAYLGLNYSFALFIGGHVGPAVVKAYRDYFKPSALYAEPRTSVCASVICAETEEAAQRAASSRFLWRLRSALGQRSAVPSPDDALAYQYRPEELAYLEDMRRRTIIGDPAQVKTKLLELAEACGTGEIFILTVVYDFQTRVRSYELIADALGLQPTTSATSPASAVPPA